MGDSSSEPLMEVEVEVATSSYITPNATWPNWAKCVVCHERVLGENGGSVEKIQDLYSSRSFYSLPCAHFVCSSQCVQDCKRETQEGTESSRCPCCFEMFLNSTVLNSKTIRLLQDISCQNTVRLKKKCGECIRKNAIAAGFCVECSLVLCQICIEDHSMQIASSNHSITDTSPHMHNVVPESQVCSEHPDYQYSAYCTTCDLELCPLCVQDQKETHVGHNLSDSKGFSNQMKNELENMLNEHRKMAATLRDAQESFRRQQTIVEEDSKELCLELSKIFENLITKIYQHFEGDLKEDIICAVTKEAYKMNLQYACLTNLSDRLERCTTFIQILEENELMNDNLELSLHLNRSMKRLLKDVVMMKTKVKEELDEGIELKLIDRSDEFLKALDNILIPIIALCDIDEQNKESELIGPQSRESSTTSSCSDFSQVISLQAAVIAASVIIDEPVVKSVSVLPPADVCVDAPPPVEPFVVTDNSNSSNVDEFAYIDDYSSDDERILVKNEPLDYDDRDEAPADEDELDSLQIENEIDSLPDEDYEGRAVASSSAPSEDGANSCGQYYIHSRSSFSSEDSSRGENTVENERESSKDHPDKETTTNSQIHADNIPQLPQNVPTSNQTMISPNNKTENSEKYLNVLEQGFTPPSTPSPFSDQEEKNAASDEEFFKHFDHTTKEIHQQQQHGDKPEEVLDYETGLLVRTSSTEHDEDKNQTKSQKTNDDAFVQPPKINEIVPQSDGKSENIIDSFVDKASEKSSQNEIIVANSSAIVPPTPPTKKLKESENHIVESISADSESQQVVTCKTRRLSLRSAAPSIITGPNPTTVAIASSSTTLVVSPNVKTISINPQENKQTSSSKQNSPSTHLLVTNKLLNIWKPQPKKTEITAKPNTPPSSSLSTPGTIQTTPISENVDNTPKKPSKFKTPMPGPEFTEKVSKLKQAEQIRINNNSGSPSQPPQKRRKSSTTNKRNSEEVKNKKSLQKSTSSTSTTAQQTTPKTTTTAANKLTIGALEFNIPSYMAPDYKAPSQPKPTTSKPSTSKNDENEMNLDYLPIPSAVLEQVKSSKPVLSLEKVSLSGVTTASKVSTPNINNVPNNVRRSSRSRSNDERCNNNNTSTTVSTTPTLNTSLKSTSTPTINYSTRLSETNTTTKDNVELDGESESISNRLRPRCPSPKKRPSTPQELPSEPALKASKQPSCSSSNNTSDSVQTLSLEVAIQIMRGNLKQNVKTEPIDDELNSQIELTDSDPFSNTTNDVTTAAELEAAATLLNFDQIATQSSGTIEQEENSQPTPPPSLEEEQSKKDEDSQSSSCSSSSSYSSSMESSTSANTKEKLPYVPASSRPRPRLSRPRSADQDSSYRPTVIIEPKSSKNTGILLTTEETSKSHILPNGTNGTSSTKTVSSKYMELQQQQHPYKFTPLPSQLLKRGVCVSPSRFPTPNMLIVPPKKRMRFDTNSLDEQARNIIVSYPQSKPQTAVQTTYNIPPFQQIGLKSQNDNTSSSVVESTALVEKSNAVSVVVSTFPFRRHSLTPAAEKIISGDIDMTPEKTCTTLENGNENNSTPEIKDTTKKNKEVTTESITTSEPEPNKNHNHKIFKTKNISPSTEVAVASTIASGGGGGALNKIDYNSTYGNFFGGDGTIDGIKKKRGRPPGSGSKQATEKLSLSLPPLSTAPSKTSNNLITKKNSPQASDPRKVESESESNSDSDSDSEFEVAPPRGSSDEEDNSREASPSRSKTNSNRGGSPRSRSLTSSVSPARSPTRGTSSSTANESRWKARLVQPQSTETTSKRKAHSVSSNIKQTENGREEKSSSPNRNDVVNKLILTRSKTPTSIRSTPSPVSSPSIAGSDYSYRVNRRRRASSGRGRGRPRGRGKSRGRGRGRKGSDNITTTETSNGNNRSRGRPNSISTTQQIPVNDGKLPSTLMTAFASNEKVVKTPLSTGDESSSNHKN